MEHNYPLTLDIPTACRLLGISRGFGYELVRRGEFPCAVIRAGRRLLVSRNALERLLEAAGAQGREPRA